MAHLAAVQLLHIQFGIAAAYGLVFVPLTLALTLLLASLEGAQLLTGRQIWQYRTQRWERLIGLSLVLLLGTGLYLLSTLGIGLVITMLSDAQQDSLVSDFLRIDAMSSLADLDIAIPGLPHAVHWLADRVVAPATLLEGTGIAAPWCNTLGMLGLGSVLLSLSIFHFRKSLD